jgi:uncharacterized membrane protein
MTSPRLLSTLAVLVLAIVVYAAAHRLAHPSVGADIVIMGVVIVMLAVLPRYVAKRITRTPRRGDHPSQDLPAS